MISREDLLRKMPDGEKEGGQANRPKKGSQSTRGHRREKLGDDVKQRIKGERSKLDYICTQFSDLRNDNHAPVRPTK